MSPNTRHGRLLRFLCCREARSGRSRPDARATCHVGSAKAEGCAGAGAPWRASSSVEFAATDTKPWPCGITLQVYCCERHLRGVVTQGHGNPGRQE